MNWSTGATDNGGSFDPSNANFAADLTTDANTGNTASPVVSSASYNFAAGDVGHWLFVKSGTNWTPGWYQIASVASNKATLTAGVGTAVLLGTSTTGLNYQRPNGLNTAAGVATVGTPTAGTWGIDYSQNTANRVTFADLVIDGTTNTDFTSAAFPVGVNYLGNTINITSGTGFTVQRVQINSIPSGVIGRADKSLGTLSSTGGNGKLGGAVGSSSTLTALTQPLVAGNKVYVKATGTYTLTVTTTVTALVKGDTTNGKISVEGYTTYPGQRDGRPLITSATNSVHMITINDNDFVEFVHLKFTSTAATRGCAFTAANNNSSPVWVKDCVVDGCQSLFFSVSLLTLLQLEGCEIVNTTSATAAVVAPTTLYAYGCDIHDNTGDGIRGTAGTTGTIFCRQCIFDTNVVGVNANNANASTAVTLDSCTLVDNTSDGLKLAANTSTHTLDLMDNVFYGNVYGIENLDTQAETDANVRVNRNNAFGNNTSGPYTGLSGGYGEITLTADPFVNRASRNFAPNATAGGGALLRGGAFPAAFTSTSPTTTSYRDVGAVQHQDSPAAVLFRSSDQYIDEVLYL